MKNLEYSPEGQERVQLSAPDDGQNSDTIFTLDKETSDALRLEISASDPFNEHGIREFATTVVNYIEDRFRGYLPQATIDNLRTVPDRIFVVDTPTREEIIPAWYADNKFSLPPYESAAEYISCGDIILVETVAKYGQVLDKSTDEVKALLISRFGSEEIARNVIGREFFRYTLLHEIIHSLHPKDRQGAYEFNEFGTIRLTEDLARVFNIPSLGEYDELYAGIFLSFFHTQEDPEVINRVYFGLEEEPEIYEGIYKLFHEHVLKINDLAKVHGRIAYIAPHMIGEDLSDLLSLVSQKDTENKL